ncbi:Ribonuclease G [Dietzia timorensis]|uniref:Ribonuclease E n=1 Tax=Dietzia timorensis TaxID=499555 RepID=A0A173LKL4_9ACTN|nr:Ribonuclease G [Dietzia timorensis]
MPTSVGYKEKRVSETTIATSEQIDALPEKLRAHAAAKALGLTSKELLGALAARGITVKSAQSGVTREQLSTLVDGAAPDSAAAGAAASEDAPKAAKKSAARKPAAKKAPADEAEPKKAPAKKAAAKKSAAKKAAGKKAAPAKDAGTNESGDKDSGRAEVDTSAVEIASAEPAPVGEQAPEESKPSRSRGRRSSKRKTEEPAEDKGSQDKGTQDQGYSGYEIVTGEVSAAEERGRGGRGGRGRNRNQSVPGFSPLFLTPGESQDSSNDFSVITVADNVTFDSTATGDAEGTGGDQSQSNGSDSDSGDSGDGNGRRRRRGRRGRGRGRGEDSANDENNTGGSGDDSSKDDDSAEQKNSDGSGSDDSGDSNDDSNSDGGNRPEGSSSRRRRRRRRKSSSDDNSQNSGNDGDDNTKTEVHERPAKRRSGRDTSDDEIQGISGSTRLEAKRRRRRPGGDGRRRSHILSEAEFLARRESVERVMVVRERERHDGSGTLTQVGVLEDKVLVEHFVTTEAQRSMVGNVYLGRVQNVLPSMEAAFIDVGRGRNGVLYAGEVDWHAAGLGGKSRRIEQALKPGDSVLVQVTKDPVGQKGARLSTQISLAGRFLVFVPGGNSTGISRKLPDTERKRLKSILKEVVPSGNGVIIRTAAEGVPEEDIRRDVERLSKKWEKISADAERFQKGKGAAIKNLYTEPDLLVKVVRDLFNEDFSKLVVQGEKSWNTVNDYVSELAPEMADRLERHENDEIDVFSVYRVDEQLNKALERTVWLPSGGTLVIDRTEAMTVIDVNTGKFTGSGGNLEETVTRNNLEAAEEIVRQMRLRDIGGMIIVDFIDMVLESNQDLVVRRLTEALGRDRTRHQVSEVTSLGLVQLTRKRLGTGLIEAFSEPCSHCGGRGLILHDDPVLTSPTSDDGHDRRRGRKGKGGDSHDHSGKNRGGSNGGSGKSGKHDDEHDGPAPSAHPMILAMSKREDESGHGAQAASASKGSENTHANDAGDPVSATSAAESASAGQAGENRESTGRRRSRRSTRTAGSPTTAAVTGAESTETDNASAKEQPAAAPVAVPDVTSADLAAQPRKRARRRIVRGDAPISTPAQDVGDAVASEPAVAPAPEAVQGAVDVSAVDAAAQVPASGDELATAPRKRARRRVVRKDAPATAGAAEVATNDATAETADTPSTTAEPVAEVATAEPAPAPEPVRPASVAAAEESKAEAGEARRRSRRRVTRTAGAAEKAAPAAQTVAESAPITTTEGVGSVAELSGHEVEVAAEASELAVVNKRKRQTRRTVKRPTGDA